MATALALITAEGVEHPDLEALFTVDEETGLTGAFNLGSDMLSGRYLINLDSEDDGEIFIGCAGGVDTVATFRYREEPAPEGMTWMQADLSGLKGGHSGRQHQRRTRQLQQAAHAPAAGRNGTYGPASGLVRRG